MIKNDKVYDFLKELCQVVLPALGTLYFALSGIWGFPYGEQIVGTITAVVTFLGVCLHISSKEYYTAQMIEQDGDIDFTDIEETEEVEDNGITINDNEE